MWEKIKMELFGHATIYHFCISNLLLGQQQQLFYIIKVMKSGTTGTLESWLQFFLNNQLIKCFWTDLLCRLIHWFIDWLKKIRDNFRVYLERAHPAFLTTLVVLVLIDSKYSPRGWDIDVDWVCVHSFLRK